MDKGNKDKELRYDLQERIRILKFELGRGERYKIVDVLLSAIREDILKELVELKWDANWEDKLINNLRGRNELLVVSWSDLIAILRK